MPTKTSKNAAHKRHAGHHRRNAHTYKKVYWPYLPVLGLSLLLLATSFLPPRYQGQTLAYAKEISADNLLLATNQQRLNEARSPLSLNSQLNQAAQAKADDMAQRNYWSHQTPEGNEPWVFVEAAGYQYAEAGENLAYGFSSSVGTVDGWMRSPTHRDNMLSQSYTEAGFGFADIPDYQAAGPETVVVAFYGRPASLGAFAAAAAGNPPAQTETKPVTKAQTVTGLSSAWSSLLVGGIAGSAITGLTLNHGLRLRRLLTKSQNYFVAHPLLDVSLVIMAWAAINFARAVGYIL